jgi:hypothetical protein
MVTDQDEVQSTVSELAVAFNEGGDARMLGLALLRCPYGTRDLRHLRQAWRSGWRHLDREWGLDSRRAIRRLPEIGCGI